MESFGVHFDQAPEEWQMLSADAEGAIDLALTGTWHRPSTAGLLGRSGCLVEVRLTQMVSGGPAAPHLDWQAAETSTDSGPGTWRITLKRLPAGGPYRLETRLNPKGNKTREWAWRGDQRQWLAVGDVFLIAGQSNASGYGAAPYADAPEFGVHLFGQDARWKLAVHPLHDGTHSAFLPALQPYVPGHSPFLHFAKLLKARLGYPVGLIPAALGGSYLREWEPGGRLTENLLAMVRRAGIRPKALIFAQGESDAKGDDSATYAERFAQAVRVWRQALGADLPVITQQVGRYYSKNPREDDKAWSTVREAQRQAALTLPALAVVPALDIPLCDTIHFSSAGNLVMGERYAEAAWGLVYGGRAGLAKGPDGSTPTASHVYRAPDIRQARRVDARRIELSFADVADRLDTQEPAGRPFLVRDAEGDNPVARIVYPMDHRIELHLARDLAGSATVGAGYGENPPPLPYDVGRRLPILAFHGIHVT